MNINLIGMRGVGKSNVARRLSVMTKMPVLSTDTLVSYESGLSIPEFVARHSWQEFRQLEAQIVAKLSRLDDAIIDCGGGIIVALDEQGQEYFNEGNVAALKGGGPVVFLVGDIDRLAAKTATDPTRPVLDATRSAATLMRTREPWYQRAADWQVFVEPGARQKAAVSIVDKFELTRVS